MPLSAAAEAKLNLKPAVNGNGTTQLEDDDTIRPLCARLNARIEAFLQEEVEDQALKNVQSQTRVALGVVSAALEKYRQVALLSRVCRSEDLS